MVYLGLQESKEKKVSIHSVHVIKQLKQSYYIGEPGRVGFQGPPGIRG